MNPSVLAEQEATRAESKGKKLRELAVQRTKLAAKLNTVDSKIVELVGPTGKKIGTATITRKTRKSRKMSPQAKAARNRVKNKRTLEDTVVSIFKANRNIPMSLETLAKAAKSSGYKTCSPDFSSVVYQSINNSNKFKKAAGFSRPSKYQLKRS